MRGQECPRHTSAHGRRMFGPDLVHHPHFTRLTKRVFVLVQILLGHLVDVGVSPLLCDLYHLPTNFEIPVGIVGINDSHGYARVTPYVAVFLTAPGRVEDYMLTVAIAPHGRGLWAAIGHEGGEAGKRLLIEEIAELLRDDIRHKSSFLQC